MVLLFICVSHLPRPLLECLVFESPDLEGVVPCLGFVFVSTSVASCLSFYSDMALTASPGVYLMHGFLSRVTFCNLFKDSPSPLQTRFLRQHSEF